MSSSNALFPNNSMFQNKEKTYPHLIVIFNISEVYYKTDKTTLAPSSEKKIKNKIIFSSVFSLVSLKEKT